MNAFKHSVPYTYLEFAHTSLPNYMQTLAEDEIIFSQKPLACSFPEVMVSGFLLELLGRSIPKPLSAELQVIWSSPLCFELTSFFFFFLVGPGRAGKCNNVHKVLGVPWKKIQGISLVTAGLPIPLNSESPFK